VSANSSPLIRTYVSANNINLIIIVIIYPDRYRKVFFNV